MVPELKSTMQVITRPGILCTLAIPMSQITHALKPQVEPDARNASVGNGDRIKKYGQVLLLRLL